MTSGEQVGGWLAKGEWLFKGQEEMDPCGIGTVLCEDCLRGLHMPWYAAHMTISGFDVAVS